MKFILSLYCLLLSALLAAQTGRTITSINEGWQFTKDNAMDQSAKWETINLPHTWNVEDVMDDVPGYYRGACWYKKKLLINGKWKGKQVYLFFEGANQSTAIFINGKKAGDHTGGYTAFYIPVTDLINVDGQNELLVRVDNSYDRNIPPLSADFTFYGGIYRNVSMVVVESVHFSFNNYGSRSVFISTPEINDKTATVNIKSIISNHKTGSARIKLVTSIYNKKEKKISEVSNSYILEPGTDKTIEQAIITNHPNLWSPDDPYLYKVITSIVDEETGEILDAITNPLGFRWFHFDAGKGFFLNGKLLKLVGTSRHQDYKGIGNAVPAKLAIRDVELIKEMGGNFLRVAHYPQDPCILEACDKLGILTSVEIPIVNEITESDSFYHNCGQMQVEMIRQNFNHPSVVMWCYMNEVLLRPQFTTNRERQKVYFSNITRLAKTLDSITRNEDPHRYTMIAYHGDFNRYRDVGLIDIPMIAGWNLYSGWYGPNLNDFPVFLDQFHKTYPGKPMMVTEYGADADPRIRSNEPVRFDKSVEYATIYHRFYLKEMMKRSFVAAAMIWNLADFNSETRIESMPHINNKGLMEWDRTAKDPYYYYKAMLQKKPFVKILGSLLRGGVADSGTTACYQLLQVAGNVDEIGIIVNGRSFAVKRVENGICEWNIPFVNGINRIEVKGEKNGKVYNDRASIECRLQPSRFINKEIPFQQLNTLLGAKRFFIDSNNELWMPDQEYRDGGWGHVGGKPFKLINNNRLPYGTDKNIKGTDNDPVYQTQQTGIYKYRLSVPAGEYELTLHFAELLGGTVKGLDYNLDPADRIEPSGKRIFNVFVNDSLWLDKFNIIEQYGPAYAVTKTIKLSVKNDKGIEIKFEPVDGMPVLNALQLKRIDLRDDERNVFK